MVLARLQEERVGQAWLQQQVRVEPVACHSQVQVGLSV